MDESHPLATWLADKDQKQTEFAARVGCSGSHLTLVMQHKRGASLELALAIERETGGEVTAQQIFDNGPRDREGAQGVAAE